MSVVVLHCNFADAALAERQRGWCTSSEAMPIAAEVAATAPWRLNAARSVSVTLSLAPICMQNTARLTSVAAA